MTAQVAGSCHPCERPRCSLMGYHTPATGSALGVSRWWVSGRIGTSSWHPPEELSVVEAPAGHGGLVPALSKGYRVKQCSPRDQS